MLQAVVDGASVVVPAIWRLEVVNALIVAERRKKFTLANSAKFLLALEQFSITVDLDGLDRVFTAIIHQARQYQRSAYDASYLELAERRGLPFATKDEPLRKTAEKLGIEIFQPWV